MCNYTDMSLFTLQNIIETSPSALFLTERHKKLNKMKKYV